MKRRLISFVLVLAMTFGLFASVIPARVFAAQDSNSVLIESSDIPLRLYYDEEASHGVSQGYDDVSTSFGSGAGEIADNVNDDWERWSIPLGNGYFGANLFGRTETERIQLTEKTLANPYRISSDSSIPTDGLNNFSETYIDFGHTNASVTNYSRELDLKTAVSYVSYKYQGVTYTREYFTSYPDNAMVIKLGASSEGALGFILRPTVPWEQEYMNVAGDRGGKTGTVTSSVSDNVGTVVLSGKMEYYDIDFYGLYKVYTDGTAAATTCTNADGDTDGTVTVSGATTAYIVITLGTDYELSEEVFTSSATTKPTFSTTLDDAKAKVEGYMNALDSITEGESYEEKYQTLKTRHINDYKSLFDRVSLNLNCNESDFALTTDDLLTNYKNGSGSTYLEALYFQFGRYLLIASSREGALPANLQGTWNRYNHAPWSSGYWHNVNVQMNYWPAFATNLSETFKSYVDYNQAYMADAEMGANSQINSLNPSVSGNDGGNGWSIATGGYPFDVSSDSSIGNLGFTTQLFWEYYEYTQDKALLEAVVYPVLVSAARFITKAVAEDEDGNYLAIRTDSPEQYVNGVWYYTKGTTYAQSFAYQNNYNTLLAAKELGISFEDTAHEDYAILQTVLAQLDKYDPIVVGLSGQVKEFREEEYYGDLGEYTHRHISQLVGLYPGNVINGTTPAWLDAAIYTLTERGDKATGWGVAHRLNLWARTKDGDRAYDLVNQLLKENTATNLWDLHPPFQIDGNLGGTAGIAEMLLQSHEGYIEPLAAIPTEWASGSYTGLVARGNYEVSAAWEDGNATTFNIKSLSGGKVQVKYPGITECNLFTSDGFGVSYEVVDTDVIAFDTSSGTTYILSAFAERTEPEKVEGLSVENEFLGKSTLTWSASDDANAYNVYVAKESQPDYTLLTTVTGTSYTFKPEVGEENLRYTFRVCAVNSSGAEGKGAVCYRNPFDDAKASVDSVSASIVEENLQVAIKSGELAGSYKLYARKNTVSDWELVKESGYPIIITPYDSELKYAVSVVSLLGEESDIVALSSYNKTIDTVDYKPSNILLGQNVTTSVQGSKDIHAASYGYDKLTDGDFGNTTGRFSTSTNDTKTFLATIALPSDALLGELRIWDFSPADDSANNMGTALTIELMYEGEWATVISCATNAEIVAKRQTVSGVGSFIAFDLSGNRAQAIRITIPTPVSGKSISIYEIECTGAVIPGGKIYDENLLLGTNPYVSAATLKPTAEGGKANFTDGVYRYSESPSWWRTYWNQTNMEFDATFSFSGTALLNQLRIYDYSAAQNSASAVGPEIVIQVFNDGEWTTVSDVTIVGGAGNNIEQYRVQGTPEGSTGTEYWLQFDLGCIEAQRLRIYMPPRSTGVFGVYEIECDGFLLDDGSEYKENILSGGLFNLDSGTVWTGDLKNLTDGDATSNSRAGLNGAIEISHAFDGFVARLYTLTVNFDQTNTSRCGSSIQIKAYRNGEWTTVVDHTHTTGVLVESFDLGGVEAEMIKIAIPDKYEGGDTVILCEISCEGLAMPVPEGGAVASNNVFEGLEFVPTPEAEAKVWSPHTYDHLTDGVSDDSHRLTTSGTASFVDATLTFNGYIATLDTLSVDYGSWLQARSGTGIQIDVLQGNKWVTVLNKSYDRAYQNVVTYDLGGVEAAAVRLYVAGVYPEAYESLLTGDCININEISCTGTLAPSDKEWAEDLFEGYKFEPTDSVAVGNIWSPNTYDKITDNGALSDTNTRFGTAKGHTADGTLDFGGKVMELHTLTVNYDTYNVERCGKDLTIYVYNDGEWTQAMTYTHTEGTKVKTYDLCGVKAEKVRFTVSGLFPNDVTGDGKSGDCVMIYEMSCTGYILPSEESFEDKQSNILSGFDSSKVTLENATIHANPSVGDLKLGFDGDYSSRFAVGDAAGAYSVVIDLGGTMPLYTLSVYDWRGTETVTRSDKTDIALYMDGVWIPVIVDRALTVDDSHTDFDLMGLSASKIRITFENSKSNSRATIYEITCTTGSAVSIDRAGLLGAYEELDKLDLTDKFGYGAMREDAMKDFSSYLTDTDANQGEVDGYTQLIRSYITNVMEKDVTTDAWGDVASYNVGLEGNFRFKFYYALDESVLDSFADAYVLAELPDGTQERYYLKDMTKDSSGRYVVALDFAAAQMTDLARLRLILDESSCGAYLERSIKTYAETVIADSSIEASYPGINALLTAMLNYGGYAQSYFEHNVDNMANEGLYTEQTDPVINGSITEDAAITKTGEVSGINNVRWTLSLDTEVEVKLFFNLSADTSIGNYTFTLTDPSGNTAEVEAVRYNTRYLVHIKNISAAYLDNGYTLVMTNNADDTSATLGFSAMCYVSSALGSSNTNLVNLVKALKLYNEAANSYFGN